MAMAYGALANGGRLMEPHLVKEIRDPEGRVVERFEPRVVRQVVDGSVARSVSRVLVDVVEDGTGTQASLGLFKVAGKTGTSRSYTTDRGYAGGHSPSFVGFFPAEDPQLVVFVKLENPKGTYYGGTVAAPVTRATMEAALAARATPLDRAQLLRSVRTETITPVSSAVRFASLSVDPPVPTARVDADATSGRGGPPASSAGIPVPDVAGLPARVAVRRLHALGLRVRQDGAGAILGTYPAAGSRMMPGDTVRLKVGRSDD
jgi:membrane peptidoglycan carboxypeptidase